MIERKYEKEKHISTFKKIKSFDEMIKTPTKDICYSKVDVGVSVGDVGFINKKKTLFHKHPYYKILDCLLCGNEVNRETFFTCGYTFYKKITKIKYGKKIFRNLDDYLHYLLKGDEFE